MPENFWWDSLELQWKNAFSDVIFNHANTPTDIEIQQLQNTKVLRLAGPKAAYPNMSFELTNLSGLKELIHLEILVVAHHQIDNVEILQSHQKLKSLFLFDNKIERLNGLEELINLEQLYVQHNQLTSLQPLQQLTKLKELYVCNNLINTIDGLTEAHSDHLTKFYCLPNPHLKQREIIRAENQLGIRCLNG